MRRLLIAAAVPLLTACGSSSSSGGDAPAPGTSAGAPSSSAVQPDDVAFRVTGHGGLTPQLLKLTAGPRLTVYGDGRLYALHTDYPRAPVLLSGKADPGAVAELMDDATSSGVFDDGTDFGTVPVEDAGTTSVEALIDGELQQITVEALDYDDGLTATESANRSALIELIDSADDLADLSEVTPERVQVKLGESSPYAKPSAQWPGPEPAEFMSEIDDPGTPSCGVLEGADAEQVYAAASTNDGQMWLVDGEPMQLAVRPLRPDEDGCE